MKKEMKMVRKKMKKTKFIYKNKNMVKIIIYILSDPERKLENIRKKCHLNLYSQVHVFDGSCNSLSLSLRFLLIFFLSELWPNE